MVLYLEDVVVGTEFVTGEVTITAEEIIAFASQFDPQPFHTDPEAAKATFFGGLAASGWHTAALTMRLLVDSPFKPAGGIIGTRAEELSWPRAVRPGDELRVEGEVLEVRASRSRPEHGFIRTRSTTLNQRDEAVQVLVMSLLVKTRAAAG